MPHWMYFVWIIPNLLFVIDCAKNRRDPVWFFVLGFLGPLGAIAYGVYFWESITFPLPLAKMARQAGRKTERRCPHCGQWVDKLFPYTDGRQQRQLCAGCREQLDSVRS